MLPCFIQLENNYFNLVSLKFRANEVIFHQRDVAAVDRSLRFDICKKVHVYKKSSLVFFRYKLFIIFVICAFLHAQWSSLMSS